MHWLNYYIIRLKQDEISFSKPRKGNFISCSAHILIFFRHSEIQAFIPCVEENRSGALELINCTQQIPEMVIERMLGDRLNIEEQLDMSLDFIDAVNNILCDRTDGNKLMAVHN